MSSFIFMRGNLYIGLDQGSGGYPYETEHRNQVQTWSSEREALAYQRTCSTEGKNWVLYEIMGLNKKKVKIHRFPQFKSVEEAEKAYDELMRKYMAIQ